MTEARNQEARIRSPAHGQQAGLFRDIVPSIASREVGESSLRVRDELPGTIGSRCSRCRVTLVGPVES